MNNTTLMNSLHPIMGALYSIASAVELYEGKRFRISRNPGAIAQMLNFASVSRDNQVAERYRSMLEMSTPSSLKALAELGHKCAQKVANLNDHDDASFYRGARIVATSPKASPSKTNASVAKSSTRKVITSYYRGQPVYKEVPVLED